MKFEGRNKLVKLTALVIISLVISNLSLNAQTYCTDSDVDQYTGTQDGFRYELWNQNGQGTACMTVGEGALFSGEWSGILNYLARRGLGYDKTQQHEEIGNFYSTFNCDYNPNSESGNSYLSIYGWTVDPLVEFYIVEDWRNWIPSMANDATQKGSVNLNGSDYDIIQNTRVEQPSIEGIATFEQYFSIRKSTRNNGTINISDHFRAWEALGMEMGKMFEVSFVVEGYQSSGDFEFTELDVFLSDDPVSVPSEQNLADYLKIYSPNEAGSVSIKLNDQLLHSKVRVYDSLGKTVYSNEKIDSKIIQLTNQESGVYFISINGDEINAIHKFFIR